MKDGGRPMFRGKNVREKVLCMTPDYAQLKYWMLRRSLRKRRYGK